MQPGATYGAKAMKSGNRDRWFKSSRVCWILTGMKKATLFTADLDWCTSQGPGRNDQHFLEDFLNEIRNENSTRRQPHFRRVRGELADACSGSESGPEGRDCNQQGRQDHRA